MYGLKKKPLPMRIRILLGVVLLLLIAAALFFSTPWLGEAAPDYLPVSDIRLELEAEPSHFSRRLPVTVYNDGNQSWECDNHLTLEYYDRGTWYQLRRPFFARALTYLAYADILEPGESETLFTAADCYGYFLRNGHYRAVLTGEPYERDAAGVFLQGAVFFEFDI